MVPTNAHKGIEITYGGAIVDVIYTLPVTSCYELKTFWW